MKQLLIIAILGCLGWNAWAEGTLRLLNTKFDHPQLRDWAAAHPNLVTAQLQRGLDVLGLQDAAGESKLSQAADSLGLAHGFLTFDYRISGLLASFTEETAGKLLPEIQQKMGVEYGVGAGQPYVILISWISYQSIKFQMLRHINWEGFSRLNEYSAEEKLVIEAGSLEEFSHSMSSNLNQLGLALSKVQLTFKWLLDKDGKQIVVLFSKSDMNKYGYDHMGFSGGSSNAHKINIKSVDENGAGRTFVKISFNRKVKKDELLFECLTPDIELVQPSAIVFQEVNLEVISKTTASKGESKIIIKSATKPEEVYGTIDVYIYKDVELVGKVWKFNLLPNQNGGSYTLPGDFFSSINNYLKFAVTHTNSDKLEINEATASFDINGNGAMDYFLNNNEYGSESIAFQQYVKNYAIKGLVVLDKNVNVGWRIGGHIIDGATTLSIPKLNELTRSNKGFLIGEPYSIHAANGQVLENFIVTGIDTSGGVNFLKIAATTKEEWERDKTKPWPINTFIEVTGSPATDPYVCCWNVLGGQHFVEKGFSFICGDLTPSTTAHELMHAFLWDVNDTDNVMHYSTAANPQVRLFRYEPIQPVESGLGTPLKLKKEDRWELAAKENQWELIKRN